MLTKFAFCVVLMLSFVMSGYAQAQAFTPSPQQIEQFKNMPRAQQEALARQMGIDISAFSTNGSNGQNSNQDISDSETRVNREVDEEKIAKRLAEQSAAKERTAELKPFGYSLFNNVFDVEEDNYLQGQNPNNNQAVNRSKMAPFSPSPNTPVPLDYRMGPGDTIKIQLFGKETGQFELEVNNEGTIQIPNLGPLSVTGLTYQELKQNLTDKYAQQVIGVTPYITMGQLRSIQVYLVGEAYRPGSITLNSLSTITHALFASGGVNQIGSLRNIQLKRAGKTITTFDLYDLLVFGSTENDLRLQQGDVIFIPTVQKLVSVDGNVRRPAIYEVKGDESLGDVISIAGGLLPSAAGDTLRIARNSRNNGQLVKTVNVYSNDGKSFSLESGDYINVPESNNEFTNAIVIAGAYANPGLVQWYEGIKLSDLLARSSLLSTTDLDYGLIVRRDKFASQSQVIQFEPNKILSGINDVELNQYDQVTLFNQSGFDRADAIEEQITEGELKESEKDIKTEQADYLKEFEALNFTEKQLLLVETKNYSRKKLLAPIIARLKDEGSPENPIKLAEVTGQVKYPGVYPISRNGRIKDLIFAAGGLTESAYVQQAEISRTLMETDGSYKISHININLVDALLGETSANQPLVSKDTLNVLRTPDWFDNRKVELIGEVVFPGIYQIKKNETLSQLITRAGGLTSEANVKAAIFTREELKEREKANMDKVVEDLRQQIITSNISGSQNVKTVNYDEASLLLDELLSVEPVGRLVIDLPALLSTKAKFDITLKDGDKLYLPNISPSVSVIGEVFVPTTHILQESVSIEEYIKRSGGFTERADDSKVYIVKANGSVTIPSNNYWFDGEELMLEPGDTIVVPRDAVNYERLGLWQTVTQIFYQSVVALVAIGRL